MNDLKPTTEPCIVPYMKKGTKGWISPWAFSIDRSTGNLVVSYWEVVSPSKEHPSDVLLGATEEGLYVYINAQNAAMVLSVIKKGRELDDPFPVSVLFWDQPIYRSDVGIDPVFEVFIQTIGAVTLGDRGPDNKFHLFGGKGLNKGEANYIRSFSTLSDALQYIQDNSELEWAEVMTIDDDGNLQYVAYLHGPMIFLLEEFEEPELENLTGPLYIRMI